ncbi:hypothetical protein ACHAWF_007471 [Thalassiosira exigua]
MTMVKALLVSAFIAPLALGGGPLLADAFAPSHSSPIVQRRPLPSTPLPRERTPSSPSSWVLSAGKGFGEKPVPTKKAPSPAVETSVATSSPPAVEEGGPADEAENSGSKLLRQLRSREAVKRDDELRKLRELRETDALLAEDAGAAAIPERVAQRMGKRMLPFVGIPLFGSMASFVGFWYLAAYKDMEFQPALVATTSFVFLALGLLVSMAVSSLSFSV